MDWLKSKLPAGISKKQYKQYLLLVVMQTMNVSPHKPSAVLFADLRVFF